MLPLPLRLRAGRLPSGRFVDVIATDKKTGRPTVVLDWETGEVHVCKKAYNAEEALLISSRLTFVLDQLLAKMSAEDQIELAKKKAAEG